MSLETTLPGAIDRAPPPPHIERVVDLDGPVHYADFGGEGPTLVLVHGIGGCRFNWLPAAHGLTRFGRVLALDLLGFGRTPEAGRGHGFAAQRTLVHRFLVEVVREPAILFGNSLGGMLAIMQAASAPQTVAKLVLVSPAQPPGSLHLPSAQLLTRAMVHGVPGLGELALQLDARRGGPRKMFLDLLSLGCADVSRVPAEVVDVNVAALEERFREMPWTHQQSFLATSRALGPALVRIDRFRKWVDSISAPTLLLHGSGDRLVPVQWSEALARRRRDWSFVRLEDLGHVPQMEDAGRFVAEVEAWLRADSSRDATPTALVS